jgi:CDP-alcohol phosphatidyltransferase-like enzyme
MTITELAKICHRGKNLEEKTWWYRCHRYLSIRITWVLIRTPVSANQVSWLMIGCGIASAVLVAFENPAAGPVAIFFLYSAFILDKVDGEIARYRNTESWNGVYLDWLFHRLVPMLFHLGLLFRVYHRHPSDWILLLLTLGGSVMFLAKENSQVVYNLYPRKNLPVPKPMQAPPLPSEPQSAPFQTLRRKLFILLDEYQATLGTVILFLPVVLLDRYLQVDLLTWTVLGGYGGMCLIVLHRVIRLGGGGMEGEVRYVADARGSSVPRSSSQAG